MTSPADDLPTLIKANVFATRECDYQHGFKLKLGDEGAIVIFYIEPESEANKTDLCVGCEILAVNDHRVATVQKAEEMLNYYMDKKGLVKITASKGGRPRGTKYVLVKNSQDKSIFDTGSTTIAGLELKQKDGFICVAKTPVDGFFGKVRLNRNDCIWSVDGNTVRDIEQFRQELKNASGKIINILTYSSFRRVKTTIMSKVAVDVKGTEKWHKLIGTAENAHQSSLEDTYDLHQKLGEGAFAVVKKATHKETGAIYAVKIVNRSSLVGELEKNLREEVAILQEMNHEHIMCLHNVYATINEYHLVTEFLEGGELFDRIVAKDHYTESEARDVCKILFNALNYMAEKKVAHRDLKPENLLLQYKTSDSEIKIADFGFAKKCETDEFLSTVCGTPGYVGPEVLKRRKYGTKCDMWSMGVIVYILLGGYPPFYAEDEKELFRITMSGEFEFHDENWGHVSVGAKDLISSLLEVDPKKRASAEDVLNHKWMKADKKLLKMQNLTRSQVALKSHLAKKRFKKAINTVLFLKGFSGENAVFSGKKKTELNV